MRNQGVALCVTNLVSAMAQDNLDDFAMCYQKAVERLTRVRRRRLCLRDTQFGTKTFLDFALLVDL